MMTAIVQCPNNACGQASRLGADPLGRVFRCPRCLAKLPAAPATAADSQWTAVFRRMPPLAWQSPSEVTRNCANVNSLAYRSAPGDCVATDLDSGEVLVGPLPFEDAAGLDVESYCDFVPDATSEVFVGPVSTEATSASEWNPPAGSFPSKSVNTDERLAQTYDLRSSPSSESSLGRFRIQSLLGKGRHAWVFRAYDPILERDLALKVPRDGALKTPKAIERFLAEAKALARLHHPRIVPIYEAGCFANRHYIAMALIDGCNLTEYIHDGSLSPQRASEIVADLAEALAYAHNLGIVHRDVKPANIRVDREGLPYLMDFSIAYRPDSAEMPLSANGILGTPAYMAPEQAQGVGTVLPASDQYSLGSVFYHMLCGRPPFSGPPSYVIFHAIHNPPPSPHALAPKIPRALAAICLRALAKNPDRRYRNCSDFSADLRRWLRGETPLAYSHPWTRLRA